jgi:hypothetical protein
MGVAMTLLMSVPAWAADIDCPNDGFVFIGGDLFAFCTAEADDAVDENNEFEETPGNDLIFGGREKDRIFAERFDEDRDRVEARQGNDRIDVRDGDGDDRVDCGKGRDVVFANVARGDNILNNCERVNPN